MPNIFLNIFSEVHNFSGKDFKKDKLLQYSYQYNSISMSDYDIKKLYSEILHIKGNWSMLNYSKFNNNLYVDISLIFSEGYQSSEHEKIINEVKKICDNFVNASKNDVINVNYDNLNRLEEMIFDECYVLSLWEGGGGVIDFDIVKQFLKDIQLNYVIVNEQKSRVDCGASGGSEEIIAFLSEAVATGLAWDIIKSSLASALGIGISRININCLDKVKFKSLRGNIAYKLGESSKDLVLKKFEEKPSKVVFIFACRDKDIEVICDKKYKIKTLKHI